MSIRESLSRLKGKLKNRLHIESRGTTPTPSSANRSSLSIAAPPAPALAPTAGHDESNTDTAPEHNTRSSALAPEIGDSPGNGGPASPAIQPHTGSNDGNPTPPHNVDASNSPTSGAVSPLLPVDTTSNNPAGTDEDNPAPKFGADNKASKTGLVWTGAKVILRVVNASADAFPPLKSAVSGLKECIDIYEGVSKGCNDYGKTLEEVTGLLEELEGYLQEQGAMEMTRSVKRLCCELESQVDKLKSQMTGPLVEQWLKAVDAPGEIAECHSQIGRLLQRLILNATVNISKKIDRQDMDRRIKDMSPALASIYDSAASDKVRRGGCTPGTRKKQIKSLIEWACAPQAGKIYWINGMAGTGKTTIAYSVCDELNATSKSAHGSKVAGTVKHQDASMLGASFFCSRMIPECREVKNIVPTIAYQLARYSIPFRYALHDILESEPEVSTRALKIQYQKLILDPLTVAQKSLPTDFIVVIDALDECENTDSLGEILGLLWSTPVGLPIRFLVSSRPEPEISRRMKGRVNEQNNTRLVLHDLDADLVQADIEMYIRHKLEDIPIKDVQLSGLIQRCGVLFIYASTTCRFIRNEYHSGFLDKAVDAIIGSAPGDMEPGDERTIDGLYTTILAAALGEQSEMRQANKRKMRDILETVLCAGEPMTMAAVADLVGLENTNQVDGLLQPLRSVLNVTGNANVVTTLHASFPDYMFSKDRSLNFHCEQKPRHLVLAEACLSMIDQVKPTFNICGIPTSSSLDDAVEGLEERVKKCICPGLAYACRYWSIHLHLGGYRDSLIQPIRSLFEKRLLVWMEVLNLTKRMRFGTGIIQHAERWCFEMRIAEDLVKLVRDAGQFVSVYANHPVSQSTPHIYLHMEDFYRSGIVYQSLIRRNTDGGGFR
ncbi:unnamed protein product [Rhizoctonia solani]|uniref:Nephrocystin 3-like N-terminal domain-containing protein n=1 Tax=Rhizoctonia solani TaxID=456999 RepID=A0A8H3HEQ9_9AGAM|nr:unnamed protein product [Rhizoctonia solani]